MYSYFLAGSFIHFSFFRSRFTHPNLGTRGAQVFPPLVCRPVVGVGRQQQDMMAMRALVAAAMAAVACASSELVAGAPPPPPAPPAFGFGSVFGSWMVLQQQPAAAAVYGLMGPGGTAVKVTVTDTHAGTSYTVDAKVGLDVIIQVERSRKGRKEGEKDGKEEEE